MALVADPPARYSILEQLIGGYLVPLISALLCVAVATFMPHLIAAVFPPPRGQLLPALPSGLGLAGVLFGGALVLIATSPYRRPPTRRGRHTR